MAKVPKKILTNSVGRMYRQFLSDLVMQAQGKTRELTIPDGTFKLASVTNSALNV